MNTRAVPLVANVLLMPAQKGSRWGRAHQLLVADVLLMPAQKGSCWGRAHQMLMGSDSYRDVVVGKPRDGDGVGRKESNGGQSE
jgi:hypothetical protein